MIVTGSDLFLFGLFAITIITVIVIAYKFYNLIKPAACTYKPGYTYDPNMYSVKEDSVYNMVVQKMICKLKIDLLATKITICRFHNGGAYVNGLPMKKFTMTHETEGGSDFPMMDSNVSILNSRYSVALAQVATIDEFITHDVADCIDLNYKRDMMKLGFRSSYMFLLRQFDGKEDGYLTVYFKHSSNSMFFKEQRQIVIELLPRIMGLLNMQHEHLKGNE